MLTWSSTNSASHFRVFNAGTGFEFNGGAGIPSLSHAQFVNCGTAIFALDTEFQFKNILIYNADRAFQGYGGFVGHGEHITAHNCNNFGYDDDIGTTFYLTNSLLVNVTNWGAQFTVYSNFVSRVFGTNVFQTVGAGSHYLTENSPYRNAGTTNLSSGLLTQLRTKTTWPPLVFDNYTFSVDGALEPQAFRDTGSPDLGYHYDPLDYVLGNVRISGATLTLTNGVAVGFYSPGYAFGSCILENGASLVSEGTPTNPNRLVWYNTVQEQATTNWTNGDGILDTFGFDNYNSSVSINCKFTDFSRLTDGGLHIGWGDVNWMAGMTFRDCVFYGGGVGFNSAGWISFAGFSGNAVNCLFFRSRVTCYATDQDFDVTLGNNLFYGGSLATDDYDVGGAFSLTIRNNLFDSVEINQNSVNPTHSHNAYWNCSTNLVSTGTGDQYLTSAIAYESGPLGRFYLPSGSALLNSGSANADTLGLYHFTTTTNQVKETNSVVDIGLHYVATINGLPADGDNDGLPDYFEDRNGDGAQNGQETDWQDADSDDDGVNDGVEWRLGRNPLGNGATTDGSPKLNVFPPLK